MSALSPTNSLSLILSHVVSLFHLLCDLLDGLGHIIGKVKIPHLLRGHWHDGKCLLVLTLVSQTNLLINARKLHVHVCGNKPHSN